MNTTPRGPRSPPGVTSRPRRLSARKTSDGTNFLSRKLSKQQQPSESQDDQVNAVQRPAAQQNEGKGKEREVEQPEVQEQPPKPQFPFKSVVPDQLSELPAWYAKDVELAAASAIQFRVKYPIHNQQGPRWYRNHHLATPSLEKRPPSFFSPSFPPMAASQTRSQDSTKVPGPSRTPSGSPLPTPASSQVKIHDVRVRTRKLSNTAHDNVDMMDVTDPWGTNWHHQSPYDLGAHGDRPDATESPSAPRPRRQSTTSAPRRRTVNPSPLSQSTSAVHLASEPLTTGRVPRRLSKSRKTLRGLFGSERNIDPYRSGSAPVTPVEFGQALGRKISKTGSIIAASIAPSMNSLTPTEKKRGSVLGRLARRFSVMKRASTSGQTFQSVQSARVSMDMTYDRNGALPYETNRRSISPQKPSEPPMKRAKPADIPRRGVPLRSEFDGSPPKTQDDSHHRVSAADAVSISSVEEPAPVGKLTVANPDNSFNSEESQRDEPSFTSHFARDGESDDHRILDESLRDSPTPMDSLPHIPRAPLSVISEGETYLSSPKMHPIGTPQLFPMSPPTIPSVLSLPLVAKSAPPELPPLPAPLPQVSPVAPVPKEEHSLPPTPEGTRPPTPVEKTETPASLNYSNNRQMYPLTSPSLPSIRGSSLGYAEFTPLSRVSMIVNPPTPQPVQGAMLPSSPPPRESPTLPLTAFTVSAPAAAPQQSPQERAPPREPSPPKKDKDEKEKEGHQRTRSRRTETFKLVRTSSGHVQTVDGIFAADGEHWQVVESPVEESSKRRRERAKSPETDPKRENKRAEKESTSDDSEPPRKHEVRRKSVREPSASELPASAPSTRSPESSSHRPATVEKTDRRRSTRESRESREPYQDVVRSTRTPVIYANPSPQAVSSETPGVRVDRRPSTSTRPSSELYSLAELNALKAKDAWEIERLWKGRSLLYGPEGTTLPGTRPNITSDSRPSTIMSADLHRASSIPSVDQSTVGTSHTYFVYQAPTNSTGSHQVSQAQALYPSFMQQPSPTNYDNRSHTRPLSESVPFPKSTPPELPSLRANPLPDPPRFSSYRPSPIPGSLGSADLPKSADYWAKLAGVAVTH
ncbi:hypothetical protein BDW22DRAFT_1424524 [Trametopsis cervina]|nr:hypothetical protein BDW22DRAFT_1424524 [Trametopsis cervina]